MIDESDWVDLPTNKDDGDWVDVDQEKSYDWSNAPGDLLQTNIDALPIYGAALGGALGMGVASVPMAGAFATAGNSLKNTINSYMDEKNNNVDHLRAPTVRDAVGITNDSMEAFNMGAVQEMGGQILNKGVQSLVDPIKKFAGNQAIKAKALTERAPVENIDELMQASERLGIKPVEAMKTSNKFAQDLESGLSQSGSFSAGPTRKSYDQMFKGLDDAGQKIASMQGPESSFSIGKNLSEGLENTVNSSRAPVSEMYDGLQKELIQIPLDKKVAAQQFGALKRDPLFRTSQGKEFLSRYSQDMLDSVDNLADLKEFRTGIKGTLQKTASDADLSRADKIYDAITRIRDGSINAIASTDDMISGARKSVRSEVGGLMDDISLADAAHAGNMKDLNSLKEVLGIKGDFKSPNDFLRKLAEISEEDLTKRASNSSVDTLTKMKENFPDLFAKAKEARVNDLIQKANGVGGFNEASFIKNFDKLGKELQEVLFDKEMIQHINDLKTVKRGIPDQLGPSGTPKGLLTMDMFNPKRNVQDYLIKKTLDSGSGLNKVVRGIGKMAPDLPPILQAEPSLKSGPLNPSRLMYKIPDTKPSPLSLPKAAEGPEDSAYMPNNNPTDKNKILQKTQGSKYAQVLEKAAQKGEASFNAAHYILSQRDQAYRKQLEDNN